MPGGSKELECVLNDSFHPVVPGGAGSVWNAGCLPRAAQHSPLRALIRNSFSQQYSRDERKQWFPFPQPQIIGVKIVIDSCLFFQYASGNSLKVNVVLRVPKSFLKTETSLFLFLLVSADPSFCCCLCFVLLWFKGFYSEKFKKSAILPLANWVIEQWS